MIALAKKELVQLHICNEENIFDAVVVRIPKAYPAYWGSYSEFSVIREYANTIENLFMIGRNGMHKYNNQDHSMLTAMEAVNNIKANITTKDNIWAINTEMEYQESK
jgi:protoporphyrinogen oxidase